MAYLQRINGTIYSDGWFGYQLEQTLNRHKDEEVHLVITSPGGEVGEAIRLSDIIKAHGNVTVEFSGLAASAATWLAFAANRVVMHNDTLWLCHKCSTSVCEWDTMNEEELTNYIEKLTSQKKSLEVLDAIVAQKYLDRCKKKSGCNKSLQDIVSLMKEERYLSPDDCLAWGFVDEILEQSSQEEDIVNMINMFNLPAVPNNSNETHEEKISMTNIIEAVFSKMRDFFEPKHKEEKKNISTMKSIVNLNCLNDLLHVENFEANEDTNMVSMSAENLESINERLKNLSDCENELNEIETALNAISPAITNINGIQNKIAAVTAILDKIPTSMAQQPTPTAVQKNSEDVNVEGGDFINELANKYIKN